MQTNDSKIDQLGKNEPCLRCLGRLEMPQLNFYYPQEKKDSTISHRGGAEGARAPLEFGRAVNPIQTMGADYARHNTASPPPPDSKRYLHLS